MSPMPSAIPFGPKSSSRFGQPLDYPYLMGVYLAANAIRDLGILVDGPDCVIGKAEHIFGKHDWRSTLLDCRGRHRVAFTDANLQRVARSGEGFLDKRAALLAGQGGISAIFLTGLPLCLVAGTDYSRKARELTRRLGRPVLALPSRTLHADWLDGYAHSLSTLARHLELQKGPAPRSRVAVVGYLMDRNEQDHQANLAEMRKMLRALSLDLVSVWLSGGTLHELSRIGTAGTIVALPYAREAAKIIASRTGAQVLDLGMPIGLKGTQLWIERLGRAMARERQAQSFIDRELGRVTPALEWAVPYLFLNRRFMVVAEPNILLGLVRFLEELGARVVSAVSVGKIADRDLEKDVRDSIPGLKVRPTSGQLAAEWARARKDGAELVIASSDVRPLLGLENGFVEFGFPSHSWHALAPEPFLGFEGALALVQRIGEGLSFQGESAR